jgi:mannose-1-phosphate guanylyltransferase
VRAVVLVGGFGTRMRPLTLSTPKQMLPVALLPMIERVVAHLGRHGVDEAVLSLGYRPDAFLDHYPDARCAGVRLTYAVEPQPLDTAGAIRFAARYAGVDDTFLVVNGDVLTDLDVAALVARHREYGAEGTIHLTKVDDPSRYGVVPTDDAGRVLEFVEKPAPGTAPTDLVNAGTYVLEASVIDRIPDGRKVSIERETFPAMVADRSLYGMASPAYWIDAGTPATYLQCQLDLLDGRLSGPVAGGTAGGAGRVEQPALVGRDVEVADGALVARSVLGDGARVGAGARVEESVLMGGAVIGAGATVRRSIVGPGAVIGAGAVLDDHTMVGGGVTVPDGTTLAGARVPDEGAAA